VDHRTEDLTYGEDYWKTLDGGVGYTDSPLWEDLAHIIKELFGVNHYTGQDISHSICMADVGCAMGYLVRHLRRRGIETWGFDISEYALEHAPEDMKEHLHLWDASFVDAPYIGWQSVDRLVCLETLEHIPEDVSERTLRNLFKFVKKGGMALFTICVDENPGWDSDPTHVNIKSREWWSEMISRVGWTHSPEQTAFVQQFHFFKNHKGVFVVQK